MREEGFKGLYRGYSASVLLCGIGILQMMTYEGIKQCTNKLKHVPSYIQIFFNGVISKFLPTVVLYPLTTVRARMQKRQYTMSELQLSEGKEIVYKGMRDCFMKTWRQQGVKSFYQGFSAHMLKSVPSQGIFFVFYEMTLKLLRGN